MTGLTDGTPHPPPDHAAVIIDIVGSRGLADRRAAHDQVLATLSDAHHHIPFLCPAWPTVGDEFQAVLQSPAAAATMSAHVRLALPDHLDLRFGIGLGQITVVGQHSGQDLFDGSAWWSAREALDEANRRQVAGVRPTRTWFRDGRGSAADAAGEGALNALLVTRDFIIGSMNPRQRRLALGAYRGRNQSELAVSEGITQSAVSQSLTRSGAGALLASLSLSR